MNTVAIKVKNLIKLRSFILSLMYGTAAICKLNIAIPITNPIKIISCPYFQPPPNNSASVKPQYTKTTPKAYYMNVRPKTLHFSFPFYISSLLWRFEIVSVWSKGKEDKIDPIAPVISRAALFITYINSIVNIYGYDKKANTAIHSPNTK